MSAQPPQARIDYFSLELPGWPGVVLIVARTADGRLFFPVKTMCGILGIDPWSQVVKLRGDQDFAPYVRDDLPMPTVKGTRATCCLDWDGMGGWLTGIQSQRVRSEMQANVRTFRKQAWAAANEILLGERSPAPVRPLVRGGSHDEDLREIRSLVLQVESRLGAVEGTVFVPERDDEPQQSTGEVPVTCPVCGAHYRVQVTTLSS
jgi:hypothetical protein